MTRLTRLAALLAVLLMTLTAAPALAADVDADAEQQFLELINASRAEEGLGALVMNTELVGVARAWSHQMDADDQLHHNPSYSQQYTGEWQSMGENVGYMTWPGGSTAVMVEQLHQAFLDSPGHYANIMGPSYNQAGIGVVLAGDTLWVTVNFLDGPIPGEEPPAVERVESPAPQEEQAGPQGRRPFYVRGTR